jgi:hypothetical protein
VDQGFAIKSHTPNAAGIPTLDGVSQCIRLLRLLPQLS